MLLDPKTCYHSHKEIYFSIRKLYIYLVVRIAGNCARLVKTPRVAKSTAKIVFIFVVVSSNLLSPSGS